MGLGRRAGTEARLARRIGAFVVVTLLALTPVAAASSLPVVHIDGHYRIVSTDCYFGGGRCHATFDIEQVGATLTSPTDKYFHGHVHGDHVRVGERYPPGTSEDGWTASGTTANGGRTVTGTMVDGIGGSGTFVLTRLRS
jgi:hypothetical protein